MDKKCDGYNVDLELFCSSSLDDAGNIVTKPATEAGSGVSAMGCFGLALVESNNKQVEDEGPLLDDKGIKKVTINVCSPEMLLVLKAWALKDRAKEKDGYDIVWILKAWGPVDLARAFVSAGLGRTEAGTRALDFLESNYQDSDRTGPTGWVKSCGFVGDEAVRERRDAVGLVREFVQTVRSM